MSFFVTSAEPRQGRRPRRPRRRRRLVRQPRRGRRRHRQDLARLSLDLAPRTPATASATAPGSTPRASTIAASLAALHDDNAPGLTKETALDETGEVVNGRGDTPNRHDILTGSLPDGTAAPETCGDWTMGGAEGAAMRRPPRPHRPRQLGRRRSRGTPRTPRAAAAASRRCAAPAATASSTASPPTEPLDLGRSAGRHPPAPARAPARTDRFRFDAPDATIARKNTNRSSRRQALAQTHRRHPRARARRQRLRRGEPAARDERPAHGPRRAARRPRASPPGATASAAARSPRASARRSSTPPSRASASTPRWSGSTAARPSSPSRSGNTSTAPPRPPASRPAAPSAPSSTRRWPPSSAATASTADVVLAIWGMETNYGANRGSMRGDREPRHPRLRGPPPRLRRGAAHRRAAHPAGGRRRPRRTCAAPGPAPWATPSSCRPRYLTYAVDFTGDGRRDIWSDDPTDALASAANYLARSGWTRGQPWGVEVRLPRGLQLRQRRPVEPAARSPTGAPAA